MKNLIIKKEKLYALKIYREHKNNPSNFSYDIIFSHNCIKKGTELTHKGLNDWYVMKCYRNDLPILVNKTNNIAKRRDRKDNLTREQAFELFDYATSPAKSVSDFIDKRIDAKHLLGHAYEQDTKKWLKKSFEKYGIENTRKYLSKTLKRYGIYKGR